MTDSNEQVVQDIVARARAADRDGLAAAVRSASPNQRSVAAKQLVGDRDAYRALHDVLAEVVGP